LAVFAIGLVAMIAIRQY